MIPNARVSEPVRHVLDRLDEMGKVIRWVNNQHMAQCPAHPDRNPSLAIREGDEGALLTCHAGCSTDDVLKAMGMTRADLFPAKPAASNVVPLRPAPAPSLQWVRDYVYRDAEGEPQFKVSRFVSEIDGKKSFRQYRRDGAGWAAGLNGHVPPLYRLPEVLAAIKAGDPVVVVEGEKDADAVTELGVCGTTSPMGAGKWREEHTAALAGANVIIIADDDEAENNYTGQRHAVDIYRALDGVASAVQLALPAAGCKDVSEQLEAGYALTAIRPCSVSDLESLFASTAANEGANPDFPAFVLTPASRVEIKRVRWGWKDRMPIGELSLIPGREGTGKSLFLAWLAAELTRGNLPGEFYGRPRAVIYVASEDSWSYTVAARMKAAGADLDRLYRIDPVVAENRLVLPAHCGDVARLALDVEAAAVMLDPVISLIDHRLSVNQSSELRRALEPLRRAAEDADIMVPALAHFNKTADVDVLSKIPGSRAWAEVARAAFGIAQDEDAGCYVGSQIKNNLGRLDLPNLSYRIESVQIDTATGPADVGRLVWTGEAEAGVEEVLSRKPERRVRDTSDVTKMILAYIEECGYPVALADIYAQFPEVKGETVRTVLRRAVEREALTNPLRGHYGPARSKLHAEGLPLGSAT